MARTICLYIENQMTPLTDKRAVHYKVLLAANAARQVGGCVLVQQGNLSSRMIGKEFGLLAVKEIGYKQYLVYLQPESKRESKDL